MQYLNTDTRNIRHQEQAEAYKNLPLALSDLQGEFYKLIKQAQLDCPCYATFLTTTNALVTALCNGKLTRERFLAIILDNQNAKNSITSMFKLNELPLASFGLLVYEMYLVLYARMQLSCASEPLYELIYKHQHSWNSSIAEETMTQEVAEQFCRENLPGNYVVKMNQLCFDASCKKRFPPLAVPNLLLTEFQIGDKPLWESVERIPLVDNFLGRPPQCQLVTGLEYK